MLKNLTINVNPWQACYGLKLIKGKIRYWEEQDHSRWVFYDEKNRLYYKIWNDTYVRRDNILNGINSGFYDNTTCPGLKGVIFDTNICRGYVMHELDNKGNLPFDNFYKLIKEKTLSTGYFFHDYDKKHIMSYQNLPCLLDLDGLYHLSDLDDFLQRRWHSSFLNNNYKSFVCNLVK